MKLLLIHSYLFKTGGDWTYLNNVTETFKNNGWFVSKFGVVPFNENAEIDLDSCDKYVKSSVYINYKFTLFDLLKIFNIIFNIKIFFNLIIHIIKFKPNVIQLNSIHTTLSSSVIVAIVILKPFMKFKVFWRLLDYKLMCPNRTMQSPISNDCSLCVNKILPYPVLLKRCKNGSILGSLLSLIENSIINILIKFFTPINGYLSQSRFTANLIEKSFLDVTSKSFIIKNPYITNLPLFPTTSIEYSYDIIYFGRLSEEKGIRKLLSYISQSNISVAIVGDGPMRNLVSEYAANFNNISFHGSLWGKELYPILRKSKFSIITSIWNEVSPYSIIESLSNGVPVLGTRVGGISDMITPGFNGEFVSLSSLDDFILTVKKALLLRKNFVSTDIETQALKDYSFDEYFYNSIEIFKRA